jgi:hypothetical protein
LVDIDQMTPKAPSPSGDGNYSAEEGLLSGAPSLLVAGVTAAFIVLGAYVMLRSTRMVRKPLQRTTPDPDPTDV